MAYTPTVWTARVGTGMNNFTASGAVTGDITLTPNPTSITQEGTPFTAAAMNNIESGIVGLQPAIEDTGWVDVSFTNGSGTLKVRKKAGIVYFYIYVTGWTDGTSIATIPYPPAQQVYAIGAQSGLNTVRFEITSGGVVTIIYGTGTAGTWGSLTTAFPAD